MGVVIVILVKHVDHPCKVEKPDEDRHRNRKRLQAGFIDVLPSIEHPPVELLLSFLFRSPVLLYVAIDRRSNVTSLLLKLTNKIMDVDHLVRIPI